MSEERERIEAHYQAVCEGLRMWADDLASDSRVPAVVMHTLSDEQLAIAGKYVHFHLWQEGFR